MFIEKKDLITLEITNFNLTKEQIIHMSFKKQKPLSLKLTFEIY